MSALAYNFFRFLRGPRHQVLSERRLMPLDYTDDDIAKLREINAKHKALSAARRTVWLKDVLVWRRKLPGVEIAVSPPFTGRPNPAVTASRLIASTFSPGALVAVDRSTGRRVWSTETLPYGSSSVLAHGDVVFAKTYSTLRALDAESGREQWAVCPYGDHFSWIASSPTVSDGRLFIGGTGNRIYCLDARSGAFLWWKLVSKDIAHNVISPPVVVGPAVIAVSNAGFAVAYRAIDGRQIWRRKLDGPTIREPHVVAGRLAIATSKSLYLLSPDDGSLARRRTWRGHEIGAFAANEDTVFLIVEKECRFRGRKYDFTTVITEDHDERLIALRDGDDVFEHPAPVYVQGLRCSPETGLLYESRYDGLGIIDPTTGERMFNLPLKGKGTLSLVETRAGMIYALRERGEILALRHP